MNLGLRGLLLIVAIVLFVISVFSDTHALDLLGLGLACVAAAFVVDELGLATRIGVGNRR